MKSLVIAEKPSVARDIARVMGCSGKNGGVLENEVEDAVGLCGGGTIERYWINL